MRLHGSINASSLVSSIVKALYITVSYISALDTCFTSCYERLKSIICMASETREHPEDQSLTITNLQKCKNLNFYVIGMMILVPF